MHGDKAQIYSKVAIPSHTATEGKEKKHNALRSESKFVSESPEAIAEFDSHYENLTGG